MSAREQYLHEQRLRRERPIGAEGASVPRISGFGWVLVVFLALVAARILFDLAPMLLGDLRSLIEWFTC